MPKKVIARAPHPFVIPDKTGLEQPIADAFRKLERHLASVNTYVRSLVTPEAIAFAGDGPQNVQVSSFGGTFTIDFQADQSGPFIDCYRVYRATSGTRSSPSTPGPDAATCIASIPANRPEDGGHYRYPDRSLTITQLDPANPVRFSYWVTSVTDRDDESIFVPATNSPIETLTNGPGDQSPEQKFSILNILYNAGFTPNDASQPALVKPVAIVSSTNATPIVITVASGHPFVVGDLVAVDAHLVNTNANGWWKVSATTATSITLVNAKTGANSVGNGVGAATGTLYQQKFDLGAPPPTTHLCPIANGNTEDYCYPEIAMPNNVRFTPWYLDPTSLTPVGNQYVGAGKIQLQDGGSLGKTCVSAEWGERVAPQQARMTFSCYVRFLASTNSFIFELLDDNNTVIVQNTWAFATWGSSPRCVFNFALPGSARNITGRYKVRLTNLNINGGGAGAAMFIIAPMLTMGDVAPIFSSVTDTSDRNTNGYLGSDFLGATWARPIQQQLVRDVSAPYS